MRDAGETVGIFAKRAGGTLLGAAVVAAVMAGTLFVNDLATGNEAAAKNERSSGTIVVSRWGCDRGDAVQVTFKAVVGSEFGDGEIVRASGTVTTEIGDPPQ